MHRFKTFLLWLLIAALPLQGVAGVLKAACAPAHHVAAQGQPAPGCDDAVARQLEGATQDHDAAAGAHQSDHAHADTVGGCADGHADHADHAGQAKHGSCSACASCCIGAAVLPAAFDWAPSARAVRQAYAAPFLTFAGHIPATLERPPRHAFA